MRWWPSRGPAAEPEPRPTAPTDPGWRAHPAVQRVVVPTPSVARVETFSGGLTTWRDPRFLAPLAHGVDAAAPAGVVHGLVEPAPVPPPTAMPVVLPPVQRSAHPDRAPLTTWLLPTQPSAPTSPDLLVARTPELPVLHVPALPVPAVAAVTAPEVGGPAPSSEPGTVTWDTALPTGPDAARPDLAPPTVSTAIQRSASPTAPDNVQRDLALPPRVALPGPGPAPVTGPAPVVESAPVVDLGIPLPLPGYPDPGDGTVSRQDAPLPLLDVVQRSLDAPPEPLPVVGTAAGPLAPQAGDGSGNPAPDDPTEASGPTPAPLLGAAPGAAAPRPGPAGDLQRSASRPATALTADRPVVARTTAAGGPGPAVPATGPIDRPAVRDLPPVLAERPAAQPVGPVVARALDLAGTPRPTAGPEPAPAPLGAPAEATPQVPTVVDHLASRAAPPPAAGSLDPHPHPAAAERGLLGDGASNQPAALESSGPASSGPASSGPASATGPDLPTVSRSGPERPLPGPGRPLAATPSPLHAAPAADPGAAPHDHDVPAPADLTVSGPDPLVARQVTAGAPLLSDAPPDAGLIGTATALTDPAHDGVVTAPVPGAPGPGTRPVSWDGPAGRAAPPEGLRPSGPGVQRSTVAATPATRHPLQRFASALSPAWTVPPSTAAARRAFSAVGSGGTGPARSAATGQPPAPTRPGLGAPLTDLPPSVQLAATAAPEAATAAALLGSPWDPGRPEPAAGPPATGSPTPGSTAPGSPPRPVVQRADVPVGSAVDGRDPLSWLAPLLGTPTDGPPHPGPAKPPGSPADPSRLPVDVQCIWPAAAGPAGGGTPETYAGPDPGTAALAGGAQRDSDGSVVFPPAAGAPAVQRRPEPVTEISRTAAGLPAPALPDLDELARRLFDPLCAHLKAELRLDRERAGLVTDLRR